MHSHLDKNHHSQESGNHQLESEGGQSLNPPAFQLKADSGDPPADSPPGRQNNTGLPDELKAGVESLSGYSMDDVQVHYNSSKPGQMKAHAFAQGSEIHVAPGQEKHLPHEAWHVAQQKQGRVQPTKAMNGAPVNDDSSLEQEADQMGARAAQPMQYKASAELNQAMSGASGVAQLYEDQFAIEKTALDEGKARDIQKGILDIYEAHKTRKKDKREEMDDSFAKEAPLVGPKQDYLIYAIRVAMYTALEGVALEGETHSFTTQNTNAKEQLRKSTLEDGEKSELDKKAAERVALITQKIKTRLADDKTNSKSKNRKLVIGYIGEYARDFGRHDISDPIVQNYEKGMIETAMNWKKLVADWVRFCKDQDYGVDVITESNVGEVFVYPMENIEQEAKVATVYFDEERMVKSSTITINQGENDEEIRQIYKHRETGEEFVQDSFGAYVKRYAKRALNQYDNPLDGSGVEIKADPRKKNGDGEQWSEIAKTIPEMDDEKVYEEIRNHQRKKEVQNGSPFISFTSSESPIFGSSAAPFLGDHGEATIDLAKISKSKIFDTQTKEALKKIHNIETPDPDMEFKEGDDLVERNAAARDAMRTAELLIAGDVPLDAMVGVKAGGMDYTKDGQDNKFKP